MASQMYFITYEACSFKKDVAAYGFVCFYVTHCKNVLISMNSFLFPVNLRLGASSRSSSLFLPMRISYQITIGVTHLTLKEDLTPSS